MKFNCYGATSPEVSRREMEHKVLARRAAAEGIVLLENNGILPMKPQKIALYGGGSRMTVKGGAGSGDVHERYSVTIEEGLKNAGFTFENTLWMDRFSAKYERELKAWREGLENDIKKFNPVQTMQMFIYIGEHPKPYPAVTPVLKDELCDCDTAIYVLSRQAGEGFDRRVEKGDYLLSDIETESLRLLSKHYKHLILALNCGSVMDLSILDEIKADAVLFIGQLGMEGGNAFADVITGKVNPSGRLTDTWARKYEDYPSADTFGHRNGDLENEEYSEGIYVGYRWFDKNKITPRYPFGYGLSYTTFERKILYFDNNSVQIQVKNTGKCVGKDTLMLFDVKPESKIDCEKRALIAFTKTPVIEAGETYITTIPIDLFTAATFDEERNAFIILKGTHILFLGDEEITEINIEKDVIGERLSLITTDDYKERDFEISPRAKAILKKLSDKEKIKLVVGGGYDIRCHNNVMGAAGRTCTKLLRKGIPNIVMSDGPAGLNVNQVSAIGYEGLPRYPDGLPEDWKWGWLKSVEGLLKQLPFVKKQVYRYMTAWPSETVMAQSFDLELLEEIGKAIGREMLEIGVSVWLAPGLNIHRNPLCGRNFEYYSEDPVVSGKMAAAITRGVQSVGGVGVSQKHFCCNNQEDNRVMTSANLSQRALREIYLRAFEIAVKEGKPWTVMSSYNKVNGRHVCNTYDLLTRILRDEWGFEGLVMSDWNATEQCSYSDAINAGNDLIMPGNNGVVKALLSDLKDGKLNKKALDNSAARVLELIFKSDTCKDF